MWPNREKWVAICLPAKPHEVHYGAAELDANRPLHYPGLRWCQMRNMEIDDYYQIDMQKTRVIHQIRLLTYAERYPSKYELSVFEDGQALPSFKNEYNGPIDIKFEKPIKARVLNFRITQPMRDVQSGEGEYPSWCIYDVRITETRILGRFWDKVVESAR